MTHIKNELIVAKIEKPGDRESLIKALSIFGENDNDFNGNNGEEYLWDFIKDSGYTSNRDWLMDFIRKMPEETADETIIKKYIDNWINSDRNYYKMPNLSITYDNDINYYAEFIALSYIYSY